MKLSFVIPIYNVEKYLAECVDSILPYLDDQCEVILVDDGAKDSSPGICDRYKDTNSRVVVIHKENGGLASARNAGLKQCRGDYVAFIDADDRVAPGSIVEILKWIDEGGADICFMQAEKFYPTGERIDLGDCIHREGIDGKDKDTILNYIATRPKFPGSSCTKIYRRSFLEKNDLHFPYENIQSEDLGFVRDSIMKAESYDALDCPFYEYRQQRQGSITNTVSERSIKGLLTFIEETIEAYSKNKSPQGIHDKYALSFAAYEYGVLLLNYSGLKSMSDDLKKRVRAAKWILNYSISGKEKTIKSMVSLLGVGCASKVLSSMYRLKKRLKG